MQAAKFFVLILFFNLVAPAAAPPEIYILRDELNIKKQQLFKVDDELGQLRRQQRTLQREINVTFAGQLRKNTLQIQNISDLLQTQRSREGAIDRSTDGYLTQIISTSKTNREQIEYNVQDAERRIRQLQDQINFSPLYTVSAATTAEPARQVMQTELNQQVQQLAILKEQRQRMALLQVEQLQLLNNDRAFQKSQLMEDLTALQDSLSALRSESARFEAEKVQAQLSLNTVEQQLGEQIKRREVQQRKVQDLDSALQKRSLDF